MTTPLDHVLAILEEEGLDCIVLEEGVAVRTGLSLDEGEAVTSCTCTIEVAPISEHVSVLGVFTRPLIEQDLDPDAAARLCNLLNARQLVSGAFEFDPDPDVPGPILRSTIAFEDPAEITRTMVDHLVFMNWTALAQCLPAILAVAEGADPTDAIAAL